MMKWISIVTIRRSQNCEACGGLIPKGSKAICVTESYSVNPRRLFFTYYHYIEGINLERFQTMSDAEIKQEICRKLDRREKFRS